MKMNLSRKNLRILLKNTIIWPKNDRSFILFSLKKIKYANLSYLVWLKKPNNKKSLKIKTIWLEKCLNLRKLGRKNF